MDMLVFHIKKVLQKEWSTASYTSSKISFALSVLNCITDSV